MSLESVLKVIEDSKLSAIRFEQTDTYGIARCKTIPACYFKEKATGNLNFVLLHLGLDAQCELVPDTGYGDEIGYADAVMVPDFQTFLVLPWVKRTGRILMEPTFNGEFVAGHPRVIARKQLDRLKGMGITLLSAHEHEFYLVDKETMKPINNDTNVHATVRDTPINDLIGKFIEYLPQVGVSVECVESEMGPGQVEITYKPAFGIRAADNAHTYKTSIKEIALLNGYVASFMSKPYLDKAGSSSHFCHSLWDAEGKVPLLYNPDEQCNHLSELGQQWVAGILAHARAIEILVAPTVNCLKRVTPLATPMNATWGIDNRTCLIRVKPNGEKGTYLENRAGASGCNPYLSLAATVAAGIDGIENKMKLPPAVKGSAYKPEDLPPKTAGLPTNMEDALKALLDDEVICEAFGKDFIKCFTALKMHEMKQEHEAKEKGDDEWEFNKFFKYM